MNLGKLQSYFLLSILIGTVVLVFFIFKPFLIPLALAGIFAVVLKPVYYFLLRYMKGWRSTAALLTIFLGIALIFVPIFYFGFKIVIEAQQLLVSLSGSNGSVVLHTILGYTQQIIDRYIPGSERFSAVLTSSIDGYTREALTWIVQNIGVLFSSIAQVLFKFFIFLIALYYLLRDGSHLKKILIHISPLMDKDDEVVFARLELAVKSVVNGNLSLALIQGILSGIGLTIFGVPNPILWGVAAGLSALVPGFGTSLVLLPATVFLFLFGPLWSALGLLLWAMFAVGLIDNLLGPRLVGRGANLHPLLVLLSVLGGIVLFGPSGLFLGPLSASLLIALLSIYSGVVDSVQT